MDIIHYQIKQYLIQININYSYLDKQQQDNETAYCFDALVLLLHQYWSY